MAWVVQYEEREHQMLYHDVLVYIQGVDVSLWLSGPVSITFADREGYNTASFTLDNAMDRFVLTDENLASKFRGSATDFKYSEQAKEEIYIYKSDQNRKDAFSRKKKELEDKAGDFAEEYTNNASTYGLSDLHERTVEAMRDYLPRFTERELGTPNSAQRAAVEEVLYTEIFNIADIEHIERADLEDIAKETVTQVFYDYDQGEIPLTGPPVSNEPRLTDRPQDKINISDPDTGEVRWPLAARSSILHKNDPVRIFAHNPYTEDDEWFPIFTGYISTYPRTVDYLTYTSQMTVTCFDIRYLMQKMRLRNNTIIGMQIPEVIFEDNLSIFSDIISTPSGWTQRFANTRLEEAVRDLVVGNTASGINTGVASFDEGMTVTYPDNETQASDPSNLSILEDWHSLSIFGSFDILNGEYRFLTKQEAQKIGSKSCIDGKYSPHNGLLHMLLPKEGTGADNIKEYTVDTMSNQIDWINRYDVIKEFLEQLDYQWSVSGAGDMMVEFPMYDFDPEDFGRWAPLFQVDKHLKSGTVEEESEDIVTGLVVSGGFAINTPKGIGPNSPDFPRGIVFCPILASRVGINIQQISKPFVERSERLKMLALIEFQKLMSNANSHSVEFIYQPFLTPNRPFYNVYERRLGLTTSVVNTWQMNEGANTSATLRYIRLVRNDGSRRLITGADSMPISYKKIFTGVGQAQRSGLSREERETKVLADALDGITAEQKAAIEADETILDTLAYNNAVVQTYYGKSLADVLKTPDNSAAGQQAIADNSAGPEKNTTTTTGTGIRYSPEPDPIAHNAGMFPSNVRGKPGVNLNRLAPDTHDCLLAISACSGEEMLVTCGKRNPSSNERVGGAKWSAHLEGRAFDIRLLNLEGRRIAGRVREASNAGDLRRAEYLIAQLQPGTYNLFTEEEIQKMVECAKERGYRVLNEGDHLHFEKRKGGQDWYRTANPALFRRARRLANSNTTAGGKRT
jgi:hypothetical protein